MNKAARVRGALLAFEDAMKKHPLAVMGDSDIAPVTHTFSNGIYTREIFIPKGQYIMGKIHRHEHPNFIVKGAVIMMTDAGVEKLQAYHSMVSPAGIKRFLFTLEDTIWITVHRTDANNPVDAETDIIAKSYTDIGMEYDELTLNAGGIECLG